MVVVQALGEHRRATADQKRGGEDAGRDGRGYDCQERFVRPREDSRCQAQAEDDQRAGVDGGVQEAAIELTLRDHLRRHLEVPQDPRADADADARERSPGASIRPPRWALASRVAVRRPRPSRARRFSGSTTDRREGTKPNSESVSRATATKTHSGLTCSRPSRASRTPGRSLRTTKPKTAHPSTLRADLCG